MPDQVKILSRDRVFSGYNGLDAIRLQHERFGGGLSRPISRELLVRGIAVSVLPYDPVADRVVLIEQFRIGAWARDWDVWQTEIVAGRAEEGEALDDVARRETLEETGCHLIRVEPVCRYLVNPACSTEIMNLYFGQVDAGEVSGFFGLDHEDEDIRVFTAAADEAIGWLNAGKVTNANLMIALQAFALRRDDLRGRWTAGG